MSYYQGTQKNLWTGRNDIADDGRPLYWHQAISLIDMTKTEIPTLQKKGIAILGYACDEGVKRNLGREGATQGPDAIRRMLSAQACHLDHGVTVMDLGNVICEEGNMEKAHERLSTLVTELINKFYFPVLLGGGHDIAYAHYSGIHRHIVDLAPRSTIGIINFDAHFDLRNIPDRGNSGTPFSQIAHDCNQRNEPFNYLCLGIQRPANTRLLFEKADQLNVKYLLNEEFTLENWSYVEDEVKSFIDNVSHIYLTIDLDGFSSAYAPGVSAPSPFGFNPEIASRVIKMIIDSNKLISSDIVELNPTYDLDNNTARLAARLVELLSSNLFLPTSS